VRIRLRLALDNTCRVKESKKKRVFDRVGTLGLPSKPESHGVRGARAPTEREWWADSRGVLIVDRRQVEVGTRGGDFLFGRGWGSGGALIVVPPFGPELKFEPELLRTERKSGPRFEGWAEPNLGFSPWFSRW
jgi:hypothetical protein